MEYLFSFLVAFLCLVYAESGLSALNEARLVHSMIKVEDPFLDSEAISRSSDILHFTSVRG